MAAYCVRTPQPPLQALADAPAAHRRPQAAHGLVSAVVAARDRQAVGDIAHVGVRDRAVRRVLPVQPRPAPAHASSGTHGAALQRRGAAGAVVCAASSTQARTKHFKNSKLTCALAEDRAPHVTAGHQDARGLAHMSVGRWQSASLPVTRAPPLTHPRLRATASAAAAAATWEQPHGLTPRVGLRSGHSAATWSGPMA